MTKSNHTPLLPCPFCGGEALYYEAVNGTNKMHLRCKKCPAAFETSQKYLGEDKWENVRDIITEWNTRHYPPNIVHRVNNWDKLVEALEGAREALERGRFHAMARNHMEDTIFIAGVLAAIDKALTKSALPQKEE